MYITEKSVQHANWISTVHYKTSNRNRFCISGNRQSPIFKIRHDFYTVGRVTGNKHIFFFGLTGRHCNTSSVSNMLDQLQWRILQDRRTDSRLTMFYKIVNEKVSVPKRQTHPPSKTFTQHAHTFISNTFM